MFSWALTECWFDVWLFPLLTGLGDHSLPAQTNLPHSFRKLDDFCSGNAYLIWLLFTSRALFHNGCFYLLEWKAFYKAHQMLLLLTFLDLRQPDSTLKGEPQGLWPEPDLEDILFHCRTYTWFFASQSQLLLTFLGSDKCPESKRPHSQGWLIGKCQREVRKASKQALRLLPLTCQPGMKSSIYEQHKSARDILSRTVASTVKRQAWKLKCFYSGLWIGLSWVDREFLFRILDAS